MPPKGWKKSPQAMTPEEQAEAQAYEAREAELARRSAFKGVKSVTTHREIGKGSTISGRGWVESS